MARGDASPGPAIELISPDWPAPACVRAVSTTRRGGSSAAPFDSFNLAHGVGDDEAVVEGNRARLSEHLGLTRPPCWLRQVHGTGVAVAHDASAAPVADACVTDRPGRACVVLTADCVPLLLCDRDGRRVAAVHGGWRGLAAGVVEAALAAMKRSPRTLIAWLGPAIGAEAYEVGNEVRQALLHRDPAAASAFKSSPSGRWLADLGTIAQLRLRRAGVRSIHGAACCTYTDADRFYSYRRDGQTGRMATLVWIGE